MPSMAAATSSGDIFGSSPNRSSIMLAEAVDDVAPLPAPLSLAADCIAAIFMAAIPGIMPMAAMGIAIGIAMGITPIGIIPMPMFMPMGIMPIPMGIIAVPMPIGDMPIAIELCMANASGEGSGSSGLASVTAISSMKALMNFLDPSLATISSDGPSNKHFLSSRKDSRSVPPIRFSAKT